jgi:hypothetical protein
MATSLPSTSPTCAHTPSTNGAGLGRLCAPAEGALRRLRGRRQQQAGQRVKKPTPAGWPGCVVANISSGGAQEGRRPLQGCRRKGAAPATARQKAGRAEQQRAQASKKPQTPAAAAPFRAVPAGKTAPEPRSKARTSAAAASSCSSVGALQRQRAAEQRGGEARGATPAPSPPAAVLNHPFPPADLALLRCRPPPPPRDAPICSVTPTQLLTTPPCAHAAAAGAPPPHPAPPSPFKRETRNTICTTPHPPTHHAFLVKEGKR